MSILRTILIAATLAMVLTGTLWATTDVDKINQEVPADTESPSPWVAVIYTIIALAAFCFVAFRNSRRTHLD